MVYRFVGFNLAVSHVNDAVGSLRDIVFMSNQNNGVTFTVQPREYGHDFVAGPGIQVSCRLVGQDNRR